MSDAVEGAELLDSLWAVALEVAVDRDTGTVRDLGRTPPMVRPANVTSAVTHARFVEDVSSDPQLAGLAPSGPVKWRTGFEPDRLCERLLNGALWSCYLQGANSADQLKEELATHLLGLRSLVQSGDATVSVSVAYGLELPADASIESDWGLLRAWRSTDRYVFDLGESEHPERGAVLESSTSFPLRLDPGQDPGTSRLASLNDDRWLRVAVAILLSQDPDSALPATPWAISQAQVLGAGSNGGEQRQFRKGPELSADEIPILESWLTLIAGNQLPTIAIRRLTSMVHRFDDVDAFIDAVIVWENLFGAGGNAELSFRVSTVMACVLSDTPEERVALQAEIKRLYGTRSKIVHGGAHLDSSEARAVRVRAQELTLRSVQRLLREHPELVPADASKYMAFILGAVTDS